MPPKTRQSQRYSSTVRDLRTNSQGPSKFIDKFKQQVLPAWQPIFKAAQVVPLFFLIGVIFVPTGVYILNESDKLIDIRINYTHCLNHGAQPDTSAPENVSCYDYVPDAQTALGRNCSCRISFEIPKEVPAPVFVHYYLKDFYQNHRQYVWSRDEKQLRGKVGNATHPNSVSADCKPFLKPEDLEDPSTSVYFPCGAVANSMFNDEIKMFYVPKEDEDQKVEVPLLRTGIAWESDKEKFHNPDWFEDFKTDAGLQRQFVKPKHWKKNLWELDPENPENNGLQNEDFIVWMRTAAFPEFKKLWRRVDHESESGLIFKEKLPKGEYLIEIEYNFAVKNFKGTKNVVISNTNAFGSAGSFLGLAYIITGSVCMCLGVFLLVVKVGVVRLNKNVHVE